jgi:hypothetical protein
MREANNMNDYDWEKKEKGYLCPFENENCMYLKDGYCCVDSTEENNNIEDDSFENLFGGN